MIYSNEDVETVHKKIGEQILEQNNYVINDTCIISREDDKRRWYPEERYTSNIYEILMKHTKIFSMFSITVDDVVKTITASMTYRDYINCKDNFFALPDRYLVMRNNLSKAKTEYIIKTLHKLHLVELQYGPNGVFIKLNMDILLKDEFIMLKHKKFLKHDYERIFECEQRYKSFFFEKPTKFTVNKKLNELIIGLTLAYNIDFNYNKNYFNLKQGGENWKSLLYCEVPVQVIQDITGLSFDAVLYEYNKLCNRTMYIKRHNKVYTDYDLAPGQNLKCQVGIGEHMNNANYKAYNLVKYYQMNGKDGTSYEKGHPKVTPFSAIIFIEELKNCKVGKRVIKHFNQYKKLLLQYLKFNDVERVKITNNLFTNEIDAMTQDTNKVNIPGFDLKINNEDVPYEDEIKQDFIYSIMGDPEGEEYDRTGSILSYSSAKAFNRGTDLYKNLKRLKLYEGNRSIESLCKLNKKVLNNISECNPKDMKYYVKLSKFIITKKLPEDLTRLWVNFNSNKYTETGLYYAKAVQNAYEVLQHYQLYTDVIPIYKQLVMETDTYKEDYAKSYIDEVTNFSLMSDLKTTVKFEDVYENGYEIWDNIVLA